MPCERSRRTRAARSSSSVVTHPALTDREVLVGEEAERRAAPDRCCGPAFEPRAGGVRGVLHEIDPVLRRNGSDARELACVTSVEDTAAGFLAAAQADNAVGSTIQLGTGESVSVGEIVDLVGELLGVELQVHTDPQRVRPALSEVQLLLSDPARARTVTGWTPRVALRDGLQRTIAWVEANTGRFRTGEYVT